MIKWNKNRNDIFLTCIIWTILNKTLKNNYAQRETRVVSKRRDNKEMYNEQLLSFFEYFEHSNTLFPHDTSLMRRDGCFPQVRTRVPTFEGRQCIRSAEIVEKRKWNALNSNKCFHLIFKTIYRKYFHQ